MKNPMRVVFVLAVVLVAGSVWFVLHDARLAAVASSGNSAGTEAPVQPAMNQEAPAAKTRPADNVVAQANAAAVPAAVQIPGFASDSERAQTFYQRQEALPVFLKAADESIARVSAELDAARAHASTVAEVEALETKLRTMQQVREQVLARNSDITH